MGFFVHKTLSSVDLCHYEHRFYLLNTIFLMFANFALFLDKRFYSLIKYFSEQKNGRFTFVIINKGDEILPQTWFCNLVV